MLGLSAPAGETIIAQGFVPGLAVWAPQVRSPSVQSAPVGRGLHRGVSVGPLAVPIPGMNPWAMIVSLQANVYFHHGLLSGRIWGSW